MNFHILDINGMFSDMFVVVFIFVFFERLLGKVFALSKVYFILGNAIQLLGNFDKTAVMFNLMSVHTHL